MSTWWDDDKQRYRSSLPYKVFYVWGWPVISFGMRFMRPETAHVFSLHVGIPFVGAIDRVWEAMKLVVVVPIIVLILLVAKLPGFKCKPPDAG